MFMMASADSTTTVLLQKGKRSAANFIFSECKVDHDDVITPPHLSKLLDVILDPTKKIDNFENIDWCRWIIASGQTPDEFSKSVRQYDNATTCGKVWTVNFVAYRCRTCSISPCMSLCADCFQKGDHQGHDFNMFKSQSGGACDCGDTKVMREEGFCLRHGPNALTNKAQAPPELLCVAQALFPRLFLRLILHLRDKADAEDVLDQCQHFLGFLSSLSQNGAAVRLVMAETLVNPDVYTDLLKPVSPISPLAPFMSIAYEKYTKAMLDLPPPMINITSLGLEDIPKFLNDPLNHRTFLDELVFWTIRLEFPRDMVCLLLNVMLPSPHFKEAFTRSFVSHYSRITHLLVSTRDCNTISNSMVHISVQLFSNEDLALPMSREMGLMHIMTVCLNALMESHNLLSKTSEFTTWDGWGPGPTGVVNCRSRIMKDHCYWPMVSDLNNVLGHFRVARMFMEDPQLLGLWFRFLTMFQGMNLNQREMEKHLEYEPNTYYAAFSAEIEASASPMWSLVCHLSTPQTLFLSKIVIQHCFRALEKWFNGLGYISVPPTVSPFRVSFHLPLHRNFSVVLSNAVRNQGGSLKEFLPPLSFLRDLMRHPLAIQVAFFEILAGMWVRNGLQIKGQAVSYVQCHFCTSFVDADLFLLQLGAMFLDADIFMTDILQRFHIWGWLSFHRTKLPSDSDYEPQMLDALLVFLATLVSIRTNTGLSNEDLQRQELVTLLCLSDKTHSQLVDFMPEKCGAGGTNRDFERLLAEVADYRAPNFERSGNMQQGMYYPKKETWLELFDPVHVLLRAVQRKDYQAALDRFNSFLQLQGKQVHHAWPPFKIPVGPLHPAFPKEGALHLLESKTFLGLIYSVLYRSWKDEPSVSENALALTVHLIELSLVAAQERLSSASNSSLCPTAGSHPLPLDVEDMDFQRWFPSPQLVTSIATPIGDILCTELPADSDDDSNSSDHDDEEGMDFSSPEPQVPTWQPPPASSTMLSSYPAPLALTAPSSSRKKEGAGPSTSQRHLDTGGSSKTKKGSSSKLLPKPPKTLPRPRRTPPNTPAGPSSAPTTPLKGAEADEKMLVKWVAEGAPDSGLPPHKTETYIRVGEAYGESILSLLLRLHSKLQGNRRAPYVPPDEAPEPLPNRDRMGDGPFFIEQVLNRLLGFPWGRGWIERERQRLWPPRRSTEGPSSQGGAQGGAQGGDREGSAASIGERRRRAKETQRKLMQEFAARQRDFMKKQLQQKKGETERQEAETEMEEGEESLLDEAETDDQTYYSCSICSQRAPSTEERPMGLVVLLQSTSILGHCSRQPNALPLPTNPEMEHDMREYFLEKLSYAHAVRLDELKRHFDECVWLPTINIGWQGGVHVQTCGHVLHQECHRTYLNSIQAPPKVTTLDAKRGEYSCPLCRQTSNALLPLPPSRKNTVATAAGDNPTERIFRLLLEPRSTPGSSPLQEAMGSMMESLTITPPPCYKQPNVNSPTPPSLALFVASIARGAIEMEIISRGGNLLDGVTCEQRKTYFEPLCHVLSFHFRMLTPSPFIYFGRLWAHLTGGPPKTAAEGPLSESRPPEMPLFLMDPCALFINFALVFPITEEPHLFQCLTQSMFVMVWSQAVVHHLLSSGRVVWEALRADSSPSAQTVRLILEALNPPSLAADEGPNATIFNPGVGILNAARLSCLPFLRAVALFKALFFRDQLPKIAVPGAAAAEAQAQSDAQALAEVAALTSFLGLPTVDEHLLDNSPAYARESIRTWCEDLRLQLVVYPMGAHGLLSPLFIRWFPPKLLRLPRAYDEIFQYYHAKKVCARCCRTPNEPSICLLCGTLVCLKDQCCKTEGVLEAVLHSVACGAGTSMYLAVNSSTILVIRGRRACLWGTVYLDSFGEEDRDLKRGKPLFLSEDRYALLERQWKDHSLDHIHKRWILHKDNL